MDITNFLILSKKAISDGIIDLDDMQVFDMVLDGTAYPASKNGNARVTISIPREICNKSVAELFDWDIKIVAVKKTAVNEVLRIGGE